jgi:acetyl esterase/lipase
MNTRQRSNILAAIVTMCISASAARAEDPVPIFLWENGAPGAKGDEDKDEPKLFAYPAPVESAVGTAIVICPGGGYGHLSMDKEGSDVAKWLNSLGVSAFVLDYRHAGKGYQHPAPLDDVKRAVRYVRTNAEKWKLDASRIGVMGFSAGGHLASTAGTQFEEANKNADDKIDRASSRPDFLVLCYPVISMTSEYTHKGSRKNLIGDDPSPELAKKMSSELQVTSNTPPTFIFQTDKDTGVPAENAVSFYLALRKAKVPAELHIYQNGPHGVGLAPGDPVLATWKERLADWLKVRGLLKQG